MMTTDSPSTEQLTNPLREYIGILRLRKWSIFFISLLTVGAAVFVSTRMTPMYDSSAEVLVKPITANQQLSPTVSATTLVNLDTEVKIATSTAVAVLASEGMNSAASPTALLEHVSVSGPANTQILEIAYSDPSPLQAQRGAQAFADAYLQFKEEQALKTYTSVRTGIQQQIDALQQQLATWQQRASSAPTGSTEQTQADAQVSTLISQIAILQNQIGPLNTAQIDPGQVIEPANLPTSPSSPNYPLNAGLALFVGLGLGVGLAFLRERLDDRLRGRADLEAHVGVPVLAVIPKVPGWRRKEKTKLVSLEAPKSAASEAYRTLRTAVLFATAQKDMKAIMVTSPAAGEGKTTTAANLAVSLSQTGKKVVLISADLRKPRIHKFFRLENRTGLVNVLAGEITEDQVIQLADGVSVLTSGPIPSRPAEMLQSEQMGELMERLRAHYDFVVIDSAPSLVVADGLALAPMVDGVLFVAHAENTHRGAVSAARNQLEQVGANIFGAVLNDFDPSKAKSSPYYYRYGYKYAYQYAAPPEKNGGTTSEEPRRIGRNRS